MDSPKHPNPQNTLSYEYIQEVLDSGNAPYAFRLVDHLLENHRYELFERFVEECTKRICYNLDTIFREDDIPTKCLVYSTKLLLNPIFNKFFDERDIRSSINKICMEGPLPFKKMCQTIYGYLIRYSMAMAKRSMCTLIIFRYYIPKLLYQGYPLSELKELQMETNIDYSNYWINQMIQNLITISDPQPQPQPQSQPKKKFLKKIAKFFEGNKSSPAILVRTTTDKKYAHFV